MDNSGGHDTEEAKAGKEMVFNFFESFQKIRDKMWGKTEVWTREL